ncbi:hypothetical protein [Haladaptatus sp. YSMS36]|uniref:hypothetical protein n=1 Tax=Haladaptatus sp. YSMS36 TaxID=3033384 RepID=UPI0023E7E117|nr:hypothetical protein [Haladaptatus sp. YSMS36]
MTDSWWLVMGALLLVLGGSGGALATTAPTYEISVDGSVDTPPREVTFEGDEYTVPAVSKTAGDQTITARVTGPDDTIYRVYLYNKENQILDSKRAEASAAFEFDLSGYDAGSYVLVVKQDGIFRAIHPVLVKGYDVSLDAPNKATTDSSVTVDVTVTPRGDMGDPHEVEVGIGNDQKTVIETATKRADGSYRATVSLSELSTGEHQVYAVVRGTEKAFGSEELLGLSNTNTLDITRAKTTTASGGGGDEPPAATTATVTGTPKTTATATASASPTDASTTDGTTEPPATAGESTTDESVITPSQPTSESPTDEPELVEGTGLSTGELAAGVALIAVVGGGIVAFRRGF